MSETIAIGMSTSPFDLELFNTLTFKLNNGLKEYYSVSTPESEKITLTEDQKNQSIFEIILEIINLVIENSSKIINDVLSIIFDKTIEIFLKFSKIMKKDPFISFQSFFNFFHSFGLNEISNKTLSLITGALQFKICSTRWIGEESFWINYREILPINTLYEVEIPLNQLVRTIISMKNEETRLNTFHTELNNFIELD